MITNMNIPNKILMEVIINKVKPNTINLIQVSFETNTISIKLNKKQPRDWGYPNVYKLTGTTSQIRNFMWIMKNNPNVIYIGDNRNINTSLKMQNQNPLGKIVMSYL